MARFYGEKAIVNSLTYFKLAHYGKEEDVLAVFTAVYVSKGKRADRHWQLAAWQSNLTPTKKHTAKGNTQEKTSQTNRCLFPLNTCAACVRRRLKTSKRQINNIEYSSSSTRCY